MIEKILSGPKFAPDNRTWTTYKLDQMNLTQNSFLSCIIHWPKLQLAFFVSAQIKIASTCFSNYPPKLLTDVITANLICFNLALCCLQIWCKFSS